MTLPKHSPTLPLSYDDSYEGNIRCYGKPPKGYRWLKVGDPVSEKTLMVSWSSFVPYNEGRDTYPRDRVEPNEWPAIEPIEKPVKAKPETVGDLRRDALVLEVVKRTATNVTFRIIKQCSRYIEFRSVSSFSLYTVNFPEVYTNSLYLRGNDRKQDKKKMVCTVGEFDRIAAAVREYNESMRQKVTPKPEPKPEPIPQPPLEQIRAILAANPAIAADVMRECIQVIADRK